MRSSSLTVVEQETRFAFTRSFCGRWLRWIQHAIRKRKKALIRNTPALVLSHRYGLAQIRTHRMMNHLPMPASGRDRSIARTCPTGEDPASSGHFVPDFLTRLHYTLIGIPILCAIAQHPHSDLCSVKKRLQA